MMHASGDPDHYYDQVIMPYKGKLEEWYVANQSLWTYLKCILATVWVVVFGSSGVVWMIFS